MRIKMVHRPGPASIDGIRVDRFERGCQYEVGNALGALMLAEGWAVPVSDDEPALVIPFSETDSFAPRANHDKTGPANLVREHYPPCLENRPDSASEWQPRRKQQTKI